MVMNPPATSSGFLPPPISFAAPERRTYGFCPSSASFCVAPKIFGKKSGMSFPPSLRVGDGDAARRGVAMSGRGVGPCGIYRSRAGSATRECRSSRRRPRPLNEHHRRATMRRPRPRSRRRARIRSSKWRHFLLGAATMSTNRSVALNIPPRARSGHANDAAGGPEVLASLPWKRSSAVNPPDDIMNIKPRPERPARVRARTCAT